jgi:hypothetical protein
VVGGSQENENEFRDKLRRISLELSHSSVEMPASRDKSPLIKARVKRQTLNLKRVCWTFMVFILRGYLRSARLLNVGRDSTVVDRAVWMSRFGGLGIADGCMLLPSVL